MEEKEEYSLPQIYSSYHLLPPELPEIIFGHLDAPQDLLNCTRVCTSWKDHLEDQIVSFCFDLVLPHILPYIKANTLICLSKVCRSWHNAVDKVVDAYFDDEHNSLLNHDKVNPNYPSDLEENFWLVISDFDELIRFFKQVLHPHTPTKPGSPIYYRQVSVHLSQRLLSPREFLLYVKCLDRFFRKIGTFVRKISLRLGSINGMGFVLQSIFKWTPNLRVCRFQDSGYGSSFSMSNDALPRNGDRALPELNCLKSILFKISSPDVGNAVFQSYGRQLTHLSLISPSVNEGFPSFDQLPNVKFVTITFVGGNNFADLDFYACQFRTHQIHLTALNLWFFVPVLTWEETQARAFATSLVSLLNSVSASIESVRLEMPLLTTFIDEESNYGQEILKLVGLNQLMKCKTLTLYGAMHQQLPSVEWLQDATPNLGTLEITVQVFPRNRNGGYSKMGFYKNLYSEHDFWSKLGRINLVRVDPEGMYKDPEREYPPALLYSRDGYNRSKYWKHPNLDVKVILKPISVILL